MSHHPRAQERIRSFVNPPREGRGTVRRTVEGVRRMRRSSGSAAPSGSRCAPATSPCGGGIFAKNHFPIRAKSGLPCRMTPLPPHLRKAGDRAAFHAPRVGEQARRLPRYRKSVTCNFFKKNKIKSNCCWITRRVTRCVLCNPDRAIDFRRMLPDMNNALPDRRAGMTNPGAGDSGAL